VHEGTNSTRLPGFDFDEALLANADPKVSAVPGHLKKLRKSCVFFHVCVSECGMQVRCRLASKIR
jgi:hypothetical protein